jgi:hypothetical protein
MNDDPAAPDSELPEWVVVRLTEAYYRVQNVLAGTKLWHERFTDADRARFEQPWPEIWAANQGTIGMWCRARGTSWNHGIVDVAHVLGFLDESTRNAIVALLPADDGALGSRVGTRRHQDLSPSWQKGLGILRYRGEIVREVKEAAKNVRRILDAFEEAGWPDEIFDPLPPTKAKDRRRRTVETLNKDLRLIRFRSTGHGKRIAWAPIDEDSDATPSG